MTSSPPNKEPKNHVRVYTGEDEYHLIPVNTNRIDPKVNVDTLAAVIPGAMTMKYKVDDNHIYLE